MESVVTSAVRTLEPTILLVILLFTEWKHVSAQLRNQLCLKSYYVQENDKAIPVTGYRGPWCCET
jgi:hypothetical protein